MNRHLFWIPFALLPLAQVQSAELEGITVALDGDPGSATVTAHIVDRFRLRVDVDPNGEVQPLAVRIELPDTGRDAWPVSDVEVRDEAGTAMLVQRSGIEWEKLLIRLPPTVRTFVVEAVTPPGGWPQTTSEKDRVIEDSRSGLRVRIANWPDGRSAALSLRFDDSHPSHLSKAIPILDEYGFQGTFMVNPGPKEPGRRAHFAFETQHAEWAAVVKRGNHQLANHSAHHRGAQGDDDMDREIGSAAQAIRALTPGSRLMALNLGGGTRWETTRTLRCYLDRYDQFDASSGSLGMDDIYGARVEAFRNAVQRHLERGLWCRVHFHSIGEGLSSSEANFRAALEIAREHQDRLWIAGMADIHKYQTERNSSRLTLVDSDAQSLTFQLGCTTDHALYDQPLMLELTLPTGTDAAAMTIQDEAGTLQTTTLVQDGQQTLQRFSAPPVTSRYRIQVAR
jgi:peptidoglycan/xylan/chitin deacetylase (PgdA/CDA1 family)